MTLRQVARGHWDDRGTNSRKEERIKGPVQSSVLVQVPPRSETGRTLIGRLPFLNDSEVRVCVI